MSDQDAKQEAAIHAKRAAAQSRHAAKNVATAAELAAQPIREGVEDATDKAIETTRRISPTVLGRISGDAGTGFLALSVAIYAGVIAVNKFGAVFGRRRDIVR